MRTLPGLILFFLIFTLQAQEITVFDSETEIPLHNVAIFNENKTKSSLTNFDGAASISGFSENEILIFKHMSHLELRTTKSKIRANNNEVYLEPDQNHLQEVVLSVAKFEQQRQDIPQQIVSLSSAEIQFSNPQTAADLLESSGSVYVQKSQLGGGSPMIRGFSTNRLLITVDGVRMNTAIFRSGNVQNVISIDPLSVDRTEIILGPGSVVYGSDAVGGVMNFYTLKPRFSHDETTSVSGNIYSRYATANNEKTGHADINIGGRKWAFVSSISYSDFEDLKMGSYGPDEYLQEEYVITRNGEDIIVPNEDERIQRPTGYSQISLLKKIRFRPNKTWDFSLGLNHSTTSDLPRYDRLIQKREGQLRFAEWYYGPQTWFMGNFKINKKGDGIFYDNAKFTAASQIFEESRHNREFEEVILHNSEERVNAWSANLDFEKIIDDNNLYYGFEYVLNEVNSEGSINNILTGESTPGASRYPDGSTWQSMAAYTTYLWQIQSDLTLQSGARYNHILVNADFDQNFYDFPFNSANINTGALTGSLGLNWRQTEMLEWKVNLSTAFRAPNIDDVGKVFDSEPGAVVVPNPDLKPETAYSGELGVVWQLLDKVKLDMAGFYTYLDNAMVRRDYQMNSETEMEFQGEMSRIQAIQNASEAFVYGFEAGLEINLLSALKLRSQLNLTEGVEKQEDGTEVALRHAAPLFGNTHLIWSKNRLKLDLFGEFNGQFDHEDLAPSEQNKAYLYAVDENGNPYSSSWYTLNFTGQFQISDSWIATASLENISDQRYRPYSSGITAPGRNLILAVKYIF